jgi:uncharacterized protein with FMN-binding domain
MRRAPIVVTTTVAGLAAVLTFKAREPELPAATAAGGVTTTPAAPTPSTGSGSARTATGDAIATRYGNAQVRVTVRTGRITNVEALQL